MSNKIVSKVHELLTEEKWTRAALSNYSINNIKTLDETLEEIEDPDTQDSIIESCEEHLEHTKSSIVALYFAGMLSLKKQKIDDSFLIQLIDIFVGNHKWNIVEYLCQRILSFGENKFALRTLAECYRNENEEDKMFEIWERLINVDIEETEIVKQIAEKHEQDGNIEAAVNYYKKAIHRYINKSAVSSVKETWHKLILFCPDEIDFFLNLEKKIAKTLGNEKAAPLLEDLYPVVKKEEDWETAIEVLKRILEYEPKNTMARKELVECYMEKYKDHSQLEAYIKLSNLKMTWRNVHDAIADFEKHIAFDEGNFVAHRSWGIGLIRSIKNDNIIIDFARKRNHTMSLKMAVNALLTLSKDHIWVLKAIWSKEKLKNKVKTDIPWALKTIIRSFDNNADMKKIKSELVPSVLTPGEWTLWNTNARKILKTDPAFGNLPDKMDQFEVRNKPISYEEKTFNKFRAGKDFFDRVNTAKEFLGNADPSSEYFTEMLGYFTGFLKSYSMVDAQVIGSFFFLKELFAQYPFLNTTGIEFDFDSLYSEIEDVSAIYIAINDADIRKDFLQAIKESQENWADIYLQLFPFSLNKYMIDDLLSSGYKEKLLDYYSTIIDNHRENSITFIWLIRNLVDEDPFNGHVSLEKIFIGMIRLLDITFRDITNRKDVSLNRKLNKQIQNFLFKEQRLPLFIEQADEDSITRISTLVDDIKDLDPAKKLELRNKILERFPDFKFMGDEESKTAARIGFYVTQKSLTRKQKELQHILEVEVPKNSKEIGAAIELGDLRENAEYKAAKEKQEMLNNSAARIKEELEKAQVFDASARDKDTVSFGTKITLMNKINNKQEEYTILGPWESDPNKNVISYLSPLGNELWRHKKGEELQFNINDIDYHYEVKNVELLDL